MTSTEKAQRLLLESCLEILSQENMAYVELNAFLDGRMTAIDVIDLLGKDNDNPHQ